MKKIGLTVFIVFLVIILALWVFTKISSVHLAARTVVLSFYALLDRKIGVVEKVLLTQFSQQTGPSGKGYGTLTYYVIGTSNDAWAHTRFLIDSYRSHWKVVELKRDMTKC